jgi:hypothetical protein
MDSSNQDLLFARGALVYAELVLQLLLVQVASQQITELFKMGNVFALLDFIKLLTLMDLLHVLLAIPHALVALYFQLCATIAMELQTEFWVLTLTINRLVFAEQDLLKMPIDNVFNQIVLVAHLTVLNATQF